jgi:hypothetical protein
VLQVQTIFIRSMSNPFLFKSNPFLFKSNPFLFKSNAPIGDIEAEVTNMAARQEKGIFYR